ncbi:MULTISPECIES: undecaprenyl-diphosphatase [Bacillus]|uniref:undecaprenyl-diphosphatase n=1 Tax=Bacillus TaxID=1386 RepID=UPI000304B7BC|nr:MULTISPECIES: undecaprenyl-diphosphatase [Bacillus]
MNIPYNADLFRLINDLGKDNTFLNPLFIFLAEYMIYFLAFALLVFWFTRTRQNRLMVGSAVFSFALAELIGKSLGHFYSNYQPFVELSNVSKLIEKDIGNSFPSDHTMVFFAICFTFFLFNKRFRSLWLFLAIFVAISRMWVGVHYPADVLTGAAVAIVSSFICYKLIPKSRVVKVLLDFYEKCESAVLPNKQKGKESQL